MRRPARYALLVFGLLAAGCGNDVVPPPPPCTVDCGGSGGGGPFVATEVFLRPLSIQRPIAGSLPTPEIAQYNLSAFYRGGAEAAQFHWTVPPEIGTVEPKAPTLTRQSATVMLKLPEAGNVPLGTFDITAAGSSGTESGTVHGRFAVVELSWMKHVRNGWIEPEPEDPVQSPTFMLTTTGADSLLMVEAPSANATRIRRIPAFSPLAATIEPVPAGVVLFPDDPTPNNFGTARQFAPDVSPAALGRREVLFATTMDSQYDERCPNGTPCDFDNAISPVPTNLWVVRQPDGINEFRPRPLTFDSSFVEFTQIRWYAVDYSQPRWDPAATAADADARISFISKLNTGAPNLWTAVLRDRNGDARSDTLLNYVRLTASGNIGGYDWHPDGTRLCVATGGVLSWINAANGMVTPIALPDSDLTRPANPAVFWRPGEHTLVAFEAQSENLANLYLWDEQENVLVRLLPFSVPVTHRMFPRWHRTKKWLVYVSDYTVMPWGSTTPGAGAVPDLLNPLIPTFDGMARTRFPSPWVLRLE